MSYEKQTWNKYDELKTEEENIENGAVVTDNRMNHIEEGIEANDKANASQSQSINNHIGDTSNPHKVTAAQVGLGNIQNFGLATEDEAKQGDSNAKYMTPSLTQAVLSSNINSIAYANSADGTDGFTTVYPNLNLLDGTKDFSGDWMNSSSWVTNGTYKNLTVKTQNVPWTPISKKFTVLTPGIYTISEYIRNTGTSASSASASYFSVNGSVVERIENGYNFDWKRVSFTRKLSAGDVIDLGTHTGTTGEISVAGYKVEQGSTATPYMQSASEVTTADWPKYVGFSNTVKTNKSASDYTWFPVKDSELTNKVESHINNKANPHAVTASQVGAYSKQEIDTKLSKAVMADDSGKVILKDFEVTTISETVNIGNGLSLNFQRKGEFVLVRFSGSLTAINSGTYFSSAVPAQWRPDGIKELIGHFASGALAFHVDLETDGRVKWWGASGATGAPRGTAMYFLK
ncbi:hypothetical protein PEG85_11675 [Lactococcus cremoris]|uniref:hypothetical protein n=1 Tax=Lactococcus lactis subsp. cremoris TaxID=1359 RepID=UPI0022E6655D|nr:hypothetical protein [Lactococcus cremoris]MDA2881576.1 hypothetical protein [Lactococcus cremoris]MDA2884101.1 hypothetical protein [Lactococcus cremoris]